MQTKIHYARSFTNFQWFFLKDKVPSISKIKYNWMFLIYLNPSILIQINNDIPTYKF